jgi:hypothetical protein
VVALHYQDVLIPPVRVVQAPRVRGVDKVVVAARHEEGWHVASRRLCYGSQAVDVEISLALHGGLDEAQGKARYQPRHVDPVLPALLHHLVRQLQKICEGRVKDLDIGMCMWKMSPCKLMIAH